MATFKELGDNIESKTNVFSNFKIGKTGQTIGTKYNQKYSDKFECYEIISRSKKPEVIDKFEMYLTERFQHHPNYDNEQIGGCEMTGSEEYIVYLVYNENL